MTTTDSALTTEQQQRAQALNHARDVLAGVSLAGRSAPDADDLVQVADYIVTGSTDDEDIVARSEPSVALHSTAASNLADAIRRGDQPKRYPNRDA